MRDYFTRLNLLSLAFLMLVSVSPIRVESSQDPQESAEQWLENNKEKVDEISRRWERDEEQLKVVQGRSLRIAKALEREMPRTGRMSHELQPTVERHGSDPDKIFRFVRDTIRNEPYAGHLRGRSGVLMSGAGNSLEKSNLLMDLLRASGFRARLVRGKLDPPQCSEWVDRFLQTRTELPEKGDVPEIDEAWIRKVAARAGISPEEAVGGGREEVRRLRELRQRTWELTSRHEKRLADALAAARIPSATDSRSLRATWERMVSDHFWVEYEDPKAARWTTLDSGFAGAEPGAMYGKEGKVLSEIPSELFGWLEIKLDLDRVAKEKAETKTLLQFKVPTSLPVFEPVRLSIVPLDGPSDPRDLLAMETPDLFQLYSGVRKFVARLQVGMRNYDSQPFDLNGKFYDVGPAGELKNLFEGIGEGIPFESEEKFSLRAITLKLSLEIPDRERVVQTRSIYEGDRPSGLLCELDLFVQPNWVSREYAAYRQGRAYVNALHKLGSGSGARCGCDCNSYPQLLLHFARTRQYAIAKLAEKGIAAVWDTPAVFLQWKRIQMNPEARSVEASLVLDLVENRGPFVPVEPDSEGTAWRANLRLGVFDSTLEGLLLADPGGASHPEFAIRHFERARLAGLPLHIFAPQGRGAEIPNRFSKRDAEWIQAHTPNGHVLAVTGEGETRHWWSVDPVTGSCVARVSGGGGESRLRLRDDAHEYAITTFLKWLQFAPEGQFWSGVFWCILYTVVYVLMYLTGLIGTGPLAIQILLCALDLGISGAIWGAIFRRSLGAAWPARNIPNRSAAIQKALAAAEKATEAFWSYWRNSIRAAQFVQFVWTVVP